MTIQDFTSKISWLGHDTFRIDGSKTVYFDPYEISGGPPADLILISHDHFDHCSPEDIQKIQQASTMIVTEKNSASKLSGNIKTVTPGDSITVDGIKVEAIPSYNTNKKFHPKQNGWLGFIIEIDGVRIYHAGDTDLIPEMNDINADIALLPVSGTYVMTSEEAVKAATAINPKVAIPMHYGSIVGGEEDADHFRNELEGKIEVIILPQST